MDTLLSAGIFLERNAGAIDEQEVILATFGGAIALTGFVLLFFGLVATAYSEHAINNRIIARSETTTASEKKAALSLADDFKYLGKVAFVHVLVGICSISASFAWLLGVPELSFWIPVGLLFGQLFFLFILALQFLFVRFHGHII